MLTTSDEMPLQTTLMGNYPNPFNPSTTISYAVAEDSHVTVEVYNTLGQLIATLADEYQKAGFRTVQWDGKDQTGRAVASGLYLALLRTGGTIATGKMLLTK